MTTTKLDLTGLKCPLPALKTRKALKALVPGDLLEVHSLENKKKRLIRVERILFDGVQGF